MRVDSIDHVSAALENGAIEARPRAWPRHADPYGECTEKPVEQVPDGLDHQTAVRIEETLDLGEVDFWMLEDRHVEEDERLPE